MPWWGWMVIGGMLLGAELFLVDIDFYFVFIGLAAILVGFLGLVGIDLPAWTQWLLFGGIAITTLVLFRSRVYAMLRRPGSGEIGDGVVGSIVTLSAPLPPGATCLVSHRGTSWTARNDTGATLSPGRARIVSVEDLTLRVGPAD